jgi:hypothetical protein
VLLQANLARAAVTVFGLSHSAVGAATLTLNSTGTLTVGNLGSTGQDGVSVDIAAALGAGHSFLWDGAIDTGPRSTGSFTQWTDIGSISGGADQVLDTLRETELASDDFELTSDFSPISNGQPLTINYYTGGINGHVVLSEQFAGTSPTLHFSNTIITRMQGQDGGGVDTGGSGFQVTTPAGVLLPLSDGIDFVDIVPPSNVTPQPSNVELTAGGGITSFTITGEVLELPEPSAIALAGLGAACWFIRRRRR